MCLVYGEKFVAITHLERLSRMLEYISLKLRNRLRINKNNNHITLSDRNRIRYCDISIRGKNNSLFFDDGANLKGVHIEIDGENCQVRIGKDCVIGEKTYLSCRGKGTSLTIGNNCMFSRNVKVMTSDGHDIFQQQKLINPNASISIDDNAWLADNCIILKGCTVGAGSIIGINALVTKDIPNNAIAAGNPARVIKENIQWTEELTL